MPHTSSIPASDFASPQDLSEALERHGYLSDEGLATACFLGLRMRRPLFLEGEAGVGKTELAKTLAAVLDVPLIRLQCYEGLDAAQALYDWDFPRQLLHLRAAEAAGVTDVAAAGVRAVRPAVPRRPAAAPGPGDLHRRAPERPARRRDRPGRRRVRGVPARGAQRLHHLHPRARHDPRRAPAGRRRHLQPHPRGARRAQAPLPLPLAGAPGLRPRGGDHPPPAARRHREPRAPGGGRRRPAARAGPAQGRRGSPRASTGPRRSSRSARATWTPTPRR